MARSSKSLDYFVASRRLLTICFWYKAITNHSAPVVRSAMPRTSKALIKAPASTVLSRCRGLKSITKLSGYGFTDAHVAQLKVWYTISMGGTVLTFIPECHQGNSAYGRRLRPLDAYPE